MSLVEIVKLKKRSIVVAIILSIILPGLGQIYQKTRQARFNHHGTGCIHPFGCHLVQASYLVHTIGIILGVEYC